MRFLRQNIFILAVIAVVVVVGGAMLVMDFSTADKIDEQVSERISLSDLLGRASGGKKVSAAVVDAEKKRVESTQSAAKKLLEQTIRWNKRNYRVLELPLVNELGEVTERIVAFPIDRKKYRDYGAVLVMTRQYMVELRSMLKNMKTTRPPTDQEIAREQANMARRLQAQKTAEEKKKRKERIAAEPTKPQTPRLAQPSFTRGRAAGVRGGSEFGPRGGWREDSEMTRGGRFSSDAGMGRSTMTRGGSRDSSGIDVTEQAKEKGFQAVRIRKAREGQIYASVLSLDVVFPMESVTASDSQLWRAQVNLWVTQDIIDVIRQTNEQVLKRFPPDQHNVTKAAVKRLVSLYVNEGYYTGGATAGTPARSGISGNSARGFAEPEFTGDRFGGRGALFGRGAAPSPAPRATRTEGGADEQTLTGRVSNQIYDVINYEFTVIIPARYLPLLQENLLRQNCHTILSIDMSNVTSAANTGTQAGQSMGEESYYYGTDPVVRTTLKCELLLLASWERGTWDDENETWSKKFPPLMPVEVLEGLNAAIPNAMRSEDQKRLSSSSSSR